MKISVNPDNPLCMPNIWGRDICSLDYEAMWQRGIRGIIFDFDCTLTSAREEKLPGESVRLVTQLRKRGFRVVILSNTGPFKAANKRVVRGATELGILSIRCETFAELKPSAWAFEAARNTLNLPPDQIIVIGDQIKNDIAGGNSAGMYTALIERLGEDSLALSLIGYAQYKRWRERHVWERVRANREPGEWYDKE